MTGLIGKTAVVVCHDSVHGPPHELRDFLLRRGISRLLFIGHRNRYVSDNAIPASYWMLYRDGALTDQGNARRSNLSEYLQYFRDFWLSLSWSWQYVGWVDFFIGAGNLNALTGILLQRFGKVRRTAYYVIDYLPVRFPNRLVNAVYHLTDRICAARSAVTWNYSRSMIDARNAKWRTAFPRQIVVPNGVRMHAPLDVKPFSMVYIGVLEKDQGLDLVLEAMALLIREFPKLELRIIGAGSYRSAIEKRALRLKLKANVSFAGFIPDHDTADRIIGRSALGVALYSPDHPYVRYTEPGKVKRYLACGTPVIMTDVSPLAGELIRNRCGFTCPFDAESVIRTVRGFFRNPNRMHAYRKNALAYARKFTWDRVFSEAFRVSLSQ